MTTTESFMNADRLLPLLPQALRDELTHITDAHPDYMPRVTFSSEWNPGETEDRMYWNIVTMHWERDNITLNIWAGAPRLRVGLLVFEGLRPSHPRSRTSSRSSAI
jgi:hypothetical protein